MLTRVNKASRTAKGRIAEDRAIAGAGQPVFARQVVIEPEHRILFLRLRALVRGGCFVGDDFGGAQ